MSIRKMVLLACAAVATVAFAVPAAASAVEWTKNEKPLTQTETVTFTGTAAFSNPMVGGLNCEVHAHATLEPGSTGKIHDFIITTNTCEKSGIFATCDFVAHEATDLPWIIHATEQENGAKDVDITNVNIHNEFENCLAPTVTLTFASVTATPDEPDPISSVTLSGSGVAHALGTELEAEASGELEAIPAGEFGIS